MATEVAELTWYHTIELPGGVVTPGEYNTRRAVAKIPFPPDLTGSRCLDVGTHDGFWAFEMERRGASDVVAIDLDDPRETDISHPVGPLSEAAVQDRGQRPHAFAVAHRALGSSVERRNLSVYALDPEEVGVFDFAFIGTLLLHLRDPVLALSAIRTVLRPGGQLLVNDAVSFFLSLRHPRRPAFELTLAPGRPFWWLPNAVGIRRYLEKAGFEVTDAGGPYFLPRGPGYARPPIPLKLGSVVNREILRRGMVHGWALGVRD
ncbi:MAG TPA: class I SAM-dependent methyltransferase [Solirubrobacteraceae bacterium]